MMEIPARQTSRRGGWLTAGAAVLARLSDITLLWSLTTVRGRDFFPQGRNVLHLTVTLAIGLAACPPAASESQYTQSLTPEESARLAELEAATERVRVAYGAGCVATPCAPTFAIADTLEAPAMWDGPSFRIWLPRRALAAGAELRPAVAHELSHWLLGHTGQDCAPRMFDCETAANAEAVRVLAVGWGMTTEEAVSLVYASLLGGLRRGNPTRGHDAPCAEVQLFARRFARPPPPCGASDAPRGSFN